MQVTIGLDIMFFFEMGSLLDGYPKLKSLRERVMAHPKIAAWIAKRPKTMY